MTVSVVARMSFERVCGILGILPHDLKAVADDAHNRYREFKIDGRQIESPYLELKNLQSKINDRILSRAPLPMELYGGIAGKSAYANAKSHLGYRYGMKIDLRKCYNHINNRHVEKALFDQVGLDPIASRLIARIIVRSDHLAQGPPSSPMMANIVLSPAARKIKEIPGIRDFWFTLYVDDLNISGHTPIPDKIINRIIGIFSGAGHPVNRKKIHRLSGQRIITGYTTNGSGLGISKDKMREIRRSLDFLTKAQGTEGYEDQYRSTRGQIEHLKPVEPKAYKELMARLRSFPSIS